jgi:hypothetical protein
MTSVAISGAVEGLVDQAVFERLVRTVRAEPGHVHRTDGKPRLLARLGGFNLAARWTPWLVLVDLDDDKECAPPFRQRWLPSAARRMCSRVAVRAIESWLLADVERLAEFLEVPSDRIPDRPDAVPDPKRALVKLAARSRSRQIRAELAPREGSGRFVGPLYTSSLIGFVLDTRGGWRPGVAARRSDSLQRCLRDLQRLVKRVHAGR